jgi:hypothetical protein
VPPVGDSATRATGDAPVASRTNETNYTKRTAKELKNTTINPFQHTDKIKDAMHQQSINLTK